MSEMKPCRFRDPCARAASHLEWWRISKRRRANVVETWLRPDESREAIADLASAYVLPATGDCEIKFGAPITIVPEIDAEINTDAKYEFARASGEPLLLRLRG